MRHDPKLRRRGWQGLLRNALLRRRVVRTTSRSVPPRGDLPLRATHPQASSLFCPARFICVLGVQVGAKFTFHCDLSTPRPSSSKIAGRILTHRSTTRNSQPALLLGRYTGATTMALASSWPPTPAGR